MSLAYEKVPALKLRWDNWNTWIAKVKDHILALDHDDAADIWDTYMWVPGGAADIADGDEGDPEPESDPADRDYQTVRNQADRSLRRQHNKAFACIRNTLSPEMFETTLRLPTSVPKLLRHLHKLVVSDGTTSDKDRLRTEYQEMKLENCSDVQDYITAFKIYGAHPAGPRTGAGGRGRRRALPVQQGPAFDLEPLRHDRFSP